MAKHVFEQQLKFYLYKIIIVSLIAITGGLIIGYYQTQDRKLEALIGGVAAGLFVALIQFLLEWNEHKETEMLQRLRIRQVSPYREGRDYYNELISKTRMEIRMLGNTGWRFLDDFANADRQDKASLLQALARGVKVRLLVPAPSVLGDELRPQAVRAQARMAELTKTYSNFEARRMSGQPFHSIVKMDDECLVGPIFPKLATQNTPTIHTYGNSVLAQRYLEYFDSEWQKAEAIS